MRVKIKSGNNQGYQAIIIDVTGFEENDNEIGAAGINVLTHEKVVVWLTTQGKAADNSNRNSIRKMRDGFKVGRNPYKLVKGGRVLFKNAFPLNDREGHYMSTWANVLGYNADDVKNYSFYSDAALLRIAQSPTNDFKPFGILTMFFTSPKSFLIGNKAEDVVGRALKCREHFRTPSFLVRLLNPKGYVTGFVELDRRANWNSDEGRPRTAEEYKEVFVSTINQALADYARGTTLNIVPATNNSITTKDLTSNDESENKLQYWLGLEKHFYKEIEADGEVYKDLHCKEVFGKMSDEINGERFINNVWPVNTNHEAPTIDPLLIGGLKYSGQLEECQSDQEQPEQQQGYSPSEQQRPAENGKRHNQQHNTQQNKKGSNTAPPVDLDAYNHMHRQHQQGRQHNQY